MPGNPIKTVRAYFSNITDFNWVMSENGTPNYQVRIFKCEHPLLVFYAFHIFQSPFTLTAKLYCLKLTLVKAVGSPPSYRNNSPFTAFRDTFYYVRNHIRDRKVIWIFVFVSCDFNKDKIYSCETIIALADLGGGVRDARPPLGVQILSISCSFRENLACSRPPWRVHAPPSGKSWIRH